MLDKYGKTADSLLDKKLWLLDMDGTLYLGNILYEGTNAFLQGILDRGGRFVFLTNNSSKSLSSYIEKAERIGMLASKDDFFTSAQAAVDYLHKNYPGERIYAQGTRSFIEGLRDAGVNVTTEPEQDVRIVLVGFDTELNFEKLEKTCKMLRKDNVIYLATNLDWTCPVEDGFVPDCGSMCFGLEKATGKSPMVIGKPQPMMAELIMEKYGVSKEETVMVGDRLYTDIQSGYNAGIDTILVLSGEATEKDLQEYPIDPTYVFDHVKDIH